MRGVKSEATKRREALGLGKKVDHDVSLRKRKAAIRSVVARGLAPKEAEPALVRVAESAHTKQVRAAKVEQDSLRTQIDAVAEGRSVLRKIMPEMAERLGRVALGREAGFAPREQLAAMRLAAEIAGLTAQQDGAGEDAPLSQRSVGTLREVIAAGERRIREIQRAISERENLTIEGEAVMLEVRSKKPQHTN
jgi:hypothetical protein